MKSQLVQKERPTSVHRRQGGHRVSHSIVQKTDTKDDDANSVYSGDSDFKPVRVLSDSGTDEQQL